MPEKLANEILSAFKEEGSAVKKKLIPTKWLRQIKLFHTLDFKIMARDLKYTRNIGICSSH